MKPLQSTDGLEAWRLIRINLSKKDGQRSQAEYDVLTALPKLKSSDMLGLSNLLVRWEAELTRFEVIDVGYALGKFQRRNIIYRALPDEIQRDVDKEVAKGQLGTYEEFMIFIKNMSASSRYRAAKPPQPLSANLVTDAPQEDYTTSDWIAWLETDEGWGAFESGYESPPEEALKATLCTLVKGGQKGQGKGWFKNAGGKSPKGKGKGKDGGKGKGKAFTGNCFNCDETGHRAADCPKPKRERSGKGVRSVEQSPNYSPATGKANFMIMSYEDAIVDYRNPWSYKSPSKSRVNQQSTSCQESVTRIDTQFPSQFDESESSKQLSDEVCSMSHESFPELIIGKSTHLQSSRKMPKFNKKTSQRIKKKSVRLTCDADDMNIVDFNKLIIEHGKDFHTLEDTPQNISVTQSKKLFCNMTCSDDRCISQKCQSEDTRNPIVMPKYKKSDFSSPIPECEASCYRTYSGAIAHGFQCAADHKSYDLRTGEKKTSKPAADRRNHMFQNMNMDDLNDSNITDHNEAYTSVAIPDDIDHRLLDSDIVNNTINMITAIEDSDEVLNVDQGLVWVQVPCAVDSGACANVSPGGIFAVMEANPIKMKAKFFAADGSPIDNLGFLKVEGATEEGVELSVDFDIAKITRPLLSVFKMTSNGHKVLFSEDENYMQLKGSNQKVHFRKEGRLFMLDLWARVPPEIARSSPFVRQVAKA